MKDGWRAQMLARNLASKTIAKRTSVVARFFAYTGDYPWDWTPEDHDSFVARSWLRPAEQP